MRTVRFVLLGTSLALSACNLAPAYHVPAVDMPATYKESGPWRPAQRSDTAPRGPWWTAFGDDTLDRLEPQIDCANQDLAAAVARYDEARAYAAEAGAYPQVSAGASLSTNKQSAHRPLRSANSPNYYGANQLDVQASYTISLPLFTGGTLDAEESAAYAKFREASANYRGTVLAAFAEVEDNLALLRLLAQESTDEEAAVKASRHTLDVALNLYKQGADSYLEVVTAQTPLLQAQQTAVEVETRRIQASVGLVRALGGGWSMADLPSDGEVVALAANKM